MSDPNEQAASAVIQDTVRVDVYKVIADAVDRGIQTGYLRAYKHSDSPSSSAIQSAIYGAVMLEIADVVIFP